MEYEGNRPKTADFEDPLEIAGLEDKPIDSIPLQRPFTQSKSQEVLNMQQNKNEPNPNPDGLMGSEIQIVLKSNWGDSTHFGLTGIAVLLADAAEPLQLKPDQLEFVQMGGGLSFAPSLQLNLQYEMSTLVDGNNVTTDAAHMWVCALPSSETLDGGLQSSGSPTIIVRLAEPRLLHGLRVWNYNASLEDSYKGVR